MLLPDAARACGFDELAHGLGRVFGSVVDTARLDVLVAATVAVLIGLFVASPFVLVLERLAATAWRVASGTQPAFGFWSVYALMLALLFAIISLAGIPAFDRWFASFGDLPMPTRLLVLGQYYFLLPLAMVGGLLYFWHGEKRRERYFSHVWAGEALLLVLVLWAFYFPAVPAC